MPIYELSIPEVYESWHWTTNYPDYHELQRYFDHADKVLDLSKDCAFSTVVTDAQFDTDGGKWNVTTADGRHAKARFMIVAAGFAAKRYIPDFPNLDKFEGVLHHSSFWPNEGVDYRGKKVAIIGTGASGEYLHLQSRCARSFLSKHCWFEYLPRESLALFLCWLLHHRCPE